MLAQHPVMAAGEGEVFFGGAQQREPAAHPGVGVDAERGNRAAGGAAAGLGVDGVLAEQAFVEEAFGGQIHPDVNEGSGHVVGQTLEMVRYLQAVAVPEVDEVQIVEHDQPGTVGGDTVHRQGPEFRGGGTVHGRMAVEPQDLLIEAFEGDPGAERDERHRPPLMPLHGEGSVAAQNSPVDVAGIAGGDGGLAEAGFGVDDHRAAQLVAVPIRRGHHLIADPVGGGELAGLDRRQVRVPHHPGFVVVLELLLRQSGHRGAGEDLERFTRWGGDEGVPALFAGELVADSAIRCQPGGPGVHSSNTSNTSSSGCSA